MVTPDVLNSVFPISRLEIYPRAIKVKRKSQLQGDYRPEERKPITHLSRGSLNNLVFTIQNSSVEFRSMITLTYGPNYPINGKKCKADLNNFLVQAKRLFGQHDYVWFLEFQERGAPHFHIITSWQAPKRCTDNKRREFASLWARIAERENLAYSTLKDKCEAKTGDACYKVHAHYKQWARIKKAGGAARYAAKYAAKQGQKEVPKNYRNVGRFWAASRSVKRAIPPPRLIDIAENWEANLYIKIKGRDDVALWNVLPKIVHLNAGKKLDKT